MEQRAAISVALFGVVLAGLAWHHSTPEGTGATGPPETVPRSSLRRPVALASADGGRWLFIANRQSGSISVLDTAALQLVAEVPVGRKLADLAMMPDGGHLLAVDEEAGELILLHRQGAHLRTPRRVQVSPGPVSVQVAADGSCCTVISLWPRRLAIVGLSEPAGIPRTSTLAPQVQKTLALAFPARLQLLLHHTARLLVADAFGGRLAVVDLSRAEVESDRQLPAHNIRGLTLSLDGTRLLVSHQLLQSLASTNRDDIHWGNLLTNGLRELPLAGVLNPQADLLHNSRLHRLGDVSRGAGDPAGVAALPSGKAVVALAGVGEVALGGGNDGHWQRVAVGRRPTAVLLSGPFHKY
jgi:YVTN family beta-propeller protein